MRSTLGNANTTAMNVPYINDAETAQELVESHTFLDAKIKGPGQVEVDGKHPITQRKGIWTQIKSETEYRNKFITTVWICVSFALLGLLVGQTGPAFLDLRLIIGEDLATSSWLLTAGTGGYLFGALVGGILYDRYNKVLFLFCALLGGSIVSGSIPWCSSLYLMMAVRFLAGCFLGAFDTGGNTQVVSTWGPEGRHYMQALNFTYAAGAIIAPFITEPFLAPKITIPSEDVNITADANTTVNLKGLNETLDFDQEKSYSVNISQHLIEIWADTRVHYSYMIIMILGIAFSVPFLLIYLKYRSDSKSSKTSNKDKGNRRSVSLSMTVKVIIVIMLMLMFHLYNAVEETFSSYLMTFCVMYLGWSKSQGSILTSVYWAAFSVGRFLGIFIVYLLQPVTLLFLFYTAVVISLIGMVLGGLFFTDILIWIFSILSGLALSVIFPTMFTWADESLLPVSGKITSLFFIAAASGQMLNPLYFGYLMETYTPMWYLYLLLGQSVLCFIVLTIVFVFSRTCINRQTRTLQKIITADVHEQKDAIS
ncbi:hypothetical protein CHS0354_014498 [Potamilus streckersoni]|uniref:Sodium-dependent glucose transporter 1 n=1 Tax=Potamilus streckersoni TaxID=2493646 RepID=A0AAE0S9U8_9BIVA|nr:hypothetical protein CHS0354_014498 [Potamilus streckersoni]